MCGATGLFPTGYLKSSSQIIPSAAAAVRVLQSVLVETSFVERTQLCLEQAVSRVVPARPPSGVAGLLEDPSSRSLGQKDFLELADMDPESSEAARGGRPEEREGGCGTARPVLVFVNWVQAEAGCPRGRGIFSVHPALPSGGGESPGGGASLPLPGTERALCCCPRDILVHRFATRSKHKSRFTPSCCCGNFF